MGSVKRFDNLDFLKCICAFLIVCIHGYFPGEIGIFIKAFSRFAVPVFFMITGFFYTDTKKNNKQKKQIIKIAKLTIISNIAFFIFYSLFNLLKGDLSDYIQKSFTIKNFIKLIVINESPFGYHLWYLGAILYVLIIAYLLDKIKLEKIMYLVVPLLLICNFVFGAYSNFFFHKDFDYLLVRNFIFIGLPHFYIGMYIRKIYDSKKLIFVRRNLLVTMSIIFSASIIAELLFLKSLNGTMVKSHYISTTCLAVVIFILAITDRQYNGSIYNHIVSIGRNYSTLIYIIHPIWIVILNYIIAKIGMYKIYYSVRPFAVFIMTLLSIWIYNKIIKFKSVR